MLVVDCKCGTSLVMDESVAVGVHRCPRCDATIQAMAPDLVPVAPAEGPGLWTKKCGCGKMIVAGQAVSDLMLRCPVCDRLIDKFHQFGTEGWRPIKKEKAEPAPAPPPAPCAAEPLEFRYDRNGLYAAAWGVLMLAALALPWHISDAGAFVTEAKSVSSWALLNGYLGSLGGPVSPLGWNAPTAVVGACLAALIAIAGGLVLRGMVRFVLTAVVGAAALALLAQAAVPMLYALAAPSAVDAGLVLLGLLILVVVTVGVRLRVGPRPIITGFIAIIGGLVGVACAAGIVMHIIALWHAVGQGGAEGWAAFWDRLMATGEYFLGFPGLPLLLGFLAGITGVLQGVVRRWDTIGLGLTLYTLVLAAIVTAAAFGILSAGLAVVNVIVLALGAAALLVMGLTNAVALCLATPDDWQRP